jgi:hypothetical protein
VITSGCDIRERWLAFTSIVFAPMRLAEIRINGPVFRRHGVPAWLGTPRGVGRLVCMLFGVHNLNAD